MRITDNTASEITSSNTRKFGVLAGIHQVSCSDGVLLRLSPRALQRLESLVREGLNTRPYSVEVGGILIGTTGPDRSIVRLQDVIPIESEHRFGPAFRPSEEDLRNVAAAIAEQSHPPRCVIGYFRSHLQENVSSLRREDENLLQRFFVDGGCAVILVQPDPVGQATALFCQWDGGDGVRLLERIPLAARQIQPELSNNHGPVPVPPPERREPRPQVAVDVPPAPRTGSATTALNYLPNGFRTPLIAGAAAIALLSVFALGRLSGPRKPVAVPVVLDLNIVGHGATVDVKWNGESAAISGSDRGSLDFVDGADFKRIELNQAQLHAGHYEYAPRQHDLTCLMTVYRNHNVFVGETKSVHLDFPKGAAAPAPPQQSAAPQPPHDQPALKIEPPAAPPRQLVKGLRTGVSPAKKPLGQKSHPKAAKFTPPPIGDSIPPAPRLEEPPKLGTADAGPTVAPSLVAPPLVDNTFSAATPVSRVTPVLSLAARSALHQEVSIRVAVSVNREGKVTGAHIIDADKDSVEKPLSSLAVKAARRWRFNPARRNGVPVASETVIAIKFSPN